MICPHCQSEVQEGAFCSVCGRSLQVEIKRPNSYIVWSILVTLLCNPLFGIPAIIGSICVYTCLSRGDYRGAQVHSKWARGLCLAATLISIIVILIALASALSENGNTY